jgi:hypothetical protein
MILAMHIPAGRKDYKIEKEKKQTKVCASS